MARIVHISLVNYYHRLRHAEWLLDHATAEGTLLSNDQTAKLFHVKQILREMIKACESFSIAPDRTETFAYLEETGVGPDGPDQHQREWDGG